MTKERARQLLKRYHPDTLGREPTSWEKILLRKIVEAMDRNASRFKECDRCGKAVDKRSRFCNICRRIVDRLSPLAVCASVLLFAGCAVPTGPKLPPPPTISPKYTLSSIPYTAPLMPPFRGCAWDPSPDAADFPELVYEVWAGSDLSAMTLATNTTECFYFEPYHVVRFYKVRAYDPVTGQYSDWATSIYHAEQP